MEVMIETCYGIDVHQKSIVCCILDSLLTTNKLRKIQRHFPEENQLLQTMPGVSEACVAVILAEIGPYVQIFEIYDHLAYWAGLCSGFYGGSGIKNTRILYKAIAIANTF